MTSYRDMLQKRVRTQSPWKRFKIFFCRSIAICIWQKNHGRRKWAFEKLWGYYGLIDSLLALLEESDISKAILLVGIASPIGGWSISNSKLRQQFLVACLRLYKSLCQLVHWFIRPSITNVLCERFWHPHSCPIACYWCSPVYGTPHIPYLPHCCPCPNACNWCCRDGLVSWITPKTLIFFSILLYKISSNLSQNCVKKNEES